MKVNGSRGYGRYQQQPPVYRLFAVSNHMGGLNSGHYTAYARHRGQRKWYYFDDRNVTEVTFSNCSVIGMTALLIQADVCCRTDCCFAGEGRERSARP
jgi:ubiquitin C-terminal hydrolase